jgi:hypothetical protein
VSRNIQWKDDVRSDASCASLLGKVICIILWIKTGRIRAASKVLFREATITLLHVLA